MAASARKQHKASAAAEPWRPFLLIVMAAALAHLWCLGSQFYMDDMPQIRDNEAIRNGEFWGSLTNLWTRLGYVIQYRLFGMSPVGFHAVNWLLHTANACVLFAFGRDFCAAECREGVALFGALLFAVHPLASEIPNYARTQDLAWVTLFSLLASWALAALPARRRLAEAGVDGAWNRRRDGVERPGIISRADDGGRGRAGIHERGALEAPAVAVAGFRRWWSWQGSARCGFPGTLGNWYHATRQWGEPRFIGHAYTLARVFWEFAWRAVIPVKLCSDHQIAESLVPPGSGWFNIPDKGAMWAAAAMLALTAVSLVLAWRKPTRLFGVCLFLFVATMLFRVAYLIPEFMPEYRIYPGMPWFCLGAAIFLCWAWRASLRGCFAEGAGGPPDRSVRHHVRKAIVCLARSRPALRAMCCGQYPAQGRAVWELHDRDIRRENWRRVIDRQNRLWPKVFQAFISENRRLAPERELPSGHFALADVACKGRLRHRTHARAGTGRGTGGNPPAGTLHETAWPESCGRSDQMGLLPQGKGAGARRFRPLPGSARPDAER